MISMCIVISWVVGKDVCYDQHVLLTKLCETLCYFIMYSKAKHVCYSKNLFTSYACILVPYNENDILYFFMLVLETFVDLYETENLQLLRHYWLGHRIGLLHDVE